MTLVECIILTARDFFFLEKMESDQFKNEKKASWNKTKEQGHLVKLVFQERKKERKKKNEEGERSCLIEQKILNYR